MDKELMKQAFDIFVNSNSEEDYFRLLKELSSKYHKTTSYLRSLRDDYYAYYSNDEEQAQYIFIKERK